MMKLKVLFFLSAYVLLSCQSNNENTFPVLSGPYLGQPLPGDEPQLFAPGVVSTPLYTRDMAMTPDGNEIYFCVSALGYNLIYFTKQESGRWSEPQPAPFIENFDNMYYEPHITPDGKKLLFLSDMPGENGEHNQDIWVVDRTGTGWGKAYNLGSPVNSDAAEFFPSVTKSGAIYFTHQPKGERTNYIYRSRLVDGKYAAPEKLEPNVNCGNNRFNAFIDPDERFIIVPAMGMADSYGGTDYYIVFRNEEDKWSKPVNLGDKVNSKGGREYSPYISPDGKYFFFMAARPEKLNTQAGELPTIHRLLELNNHYSNGNANIYWVKADFLLTLEEKAWE